MVALSDFNNSIRFSARSAGTGRAYLHEHPEREPARSTAYNGLEPPNNQAPELLKWLRKCGLL